MSKISNCLLMLKLLQSGKKYTIDELSEAIEVTPRMIRKYKTDLEEAGFYIETISGRYGGYVLEQNSKVVTPNFTLYELSLLETLYGQIEKNNVYTKKDKFLLFDLIEKVRLLTIYQDKNSSEKETNEDIDIVSKCDDFVKAKQQVLITYIKYNKEKTREVVPLYISSHNGQKYLTCDYNNQKRTYNINTITKIEKLS